MRVPGWLWPTAPLVVFVAVYSLRYVVLGERAYIPELAASFSVRPGLVLIHTLFGPIALVLGLINLLPGHRPPSRVRSHRLVGRVYLASAVLLGGAGLALSLHAMGGVVARLGFLVLALITLASPSIGFWWIRHADVRRHREWMLRSYACIFGAVTLRLWLPMLIVAYDGEFVPAYRWVAWLAWVPNVLVAEWIIRRNRVAAPPAAQLSTV